MRRPARTLLVVFALGAAGAAAGAARAAQSFEAKTRLHVEALLASLEVLPSTVRLDTITGGETARFLIAVAGDPAASPKIRVAALTSLADHPGPLVEEKLRAHVATFRTATGGPATLYLRAALRSLARVGRVDAVPIIAGELNHPSPDVRADAARALALTGSPTAVPDLRRRYAVEATDFVRHEIAEAIRVLTP